MLYCIYEDYVLHGGQAERDAIEPWLARASRIIDRMTYGRAERHAADLTEELADACTQMADRLRSAQAVQERTGGGLLASASNDGVSESYVTGTGGSVSLDRELRRLLADALGSDRYCLLGRWI